MSVAFRRDSDEEHMEPRFELPLPPGPNLVTARGLALTLAALDAVNAEVRDETDPVRLAELKRSQRYWQTRAATAELAPVPSGDAVAFGCRVTLDLDGARRVIDIVGDDEAEPASGRLAFSAPLARAVIGAEVGELLDLGERVEAIEIIAIEAIPGEQIARD